MNLNREQMLVEMGISPVWRLRPAATEAVSYTHLDVYKRQALAWQSRAERCLVLLDARMGEVYCANYWRQNGSVPVSYTHLDVYKRQPHNRVLAIDQRVVER